MAAGDVNRDGREDLIAGAPGEAIGSKAGAPDLVLHVLAIQDSRRGPVGRGARRCSRPSPPLSLLWCRQRPTVGDQLDCGRPKSRS
ncbi:FG-GAP repeat protein [Streptomyces melanosporofaciens]|uniref:FG-GAP repeat protein n=1 Tax=Streptomyces melanosporofaciens TaxID=67327 RepID=UPI000B85D721